MKEDSTISDNTRTGTTKMLSAMVGIGLICALLIVLTYGGTKPRIEALQAEALNQAIFKVLPGIESTETFYLNDQGKFVTENEATETAVYAGYSAQNELKGIAIVARGQGYADIIRVLYGYDPNAQKIIGLYVLESKETPGLGDKIEKDADFQKNFEGLDVALTPAGNALLHPVKTVKHGTKSNSWEIDGITGATISSRAIGDIIDKSTKVMLPAIQNNMDVFRNE